MQISFLDEQYSDIETTSDKRSEQGLIGNLKRWHKPIYDKFINGEYTLENAISIAQQSPPDRQPIANQSQSIAEKKREEEKRREQWFINWFNDSIKKPKGSKGKFKLNDKIKKQLHARIKDGYTSEDFIQAFNAIVSDKYHNENEYKYLTPEFITRADKLEMWSNALIIKLEEDKGKGEGGVSLEELYKQHQQ